MSDYNKKHRFGDTFLLAAEVTDKAKNPFDLTGYELEFTLDTEGAAITFSTTGTSGTSGVALDPDPLDDTGVFQLTVPSELMSDPASFIVGAKYRFDVVLISPEPVLKTYIFGRAEMLETARST